MSEAQLRRGDIVVCVLPGDHGKTGPAVVVQADLFNETHPSLAICPITSDITGRSLFRVPLGATETTGLRKASEAMADKIAAIDRSRVRDRIGHLNRTQISDVNAALRLWLELPE
jgi:mRNA interferase MazF